MDLGLILGIVSLILVIPFGILVNILTPKFNDWTSKRSLKNGKKRIDVLKYQISRIESYVNSTNKLVAFGILCILRCLILIILISAIIYEFQAGKVLGYFQFQADTFFLIFATMYAVVSILFINISSFFHKIIFHEKTISRINQRILKINEKLNLNR